MTDRFIIDAHAHLGVTPEFRAHFGSAEDFIRLMDETETETAVFSPMGILNAHQVFLAPALTPAMYRLGMIFGILVLSPRMGIYGLAWGVLIGALAHLLLQFPSLLRQGLVYTPILGLDRPEVREVFRLMGPRLLGVAVVELNFWVNTRLASYMPDGSVTGVSIAFVLMLTYNIFENVDLNLFLNFYCGKEGTAYSKNLGDGGMVRARVYF